MSWGALAGLGQGMQQVGTILMDREKARVAEELQKQREARAEERQRAKEKRDEEREAAKVADTREVQDGNRWVRRSYNSKGYVIREEDMATNEIDAILRSQRKDEEDIRYKGALADYNVAKAEGEPLRQRILNERTQAQIDTERARQTELGVRARVAGQRGSSGTDGAAPTREQAITDVMKEAGDLTKGIPPDRLYELADAAMRNAEQLRERGINRDPLAIFRIYLTNIRTGMKDDQD